MLRIDKQKTEDREVTTIGFDFKPTGVKSATAAGAFVGFLFAGIPGVIFGGLVGEVVNVLNGEQKEGK